MKKAKQAEHEAGITTNRRQFLGAALATPLGAMLYQHQATAIEYNDCEDLYAHRDGLGFVRTCVKPLAMLHAVYGRSYEDVSPDYKSENLRALYYMPISELFGRESFNAAIDGLTEEKETQTKDLSTGDTRLMDPCLLNETQATTIKDRAAAVVQTRGSDQFTTRDYIIGAYNPDDSDARNVYCAAFELNLTGFPVLFIGQRAILHEQAKRRLTDFLDVFGDLTVDGLLREPMYSRLGQRHPYAGLVDAGKKYRIFGRHATALSLGEPIFECGDAEMLDNKGPGYVCEDDVQPQPACIEGNPDQYCTMENNTCSIISDVI